MPVEIAYRDPSHSPVVFLDVDGVLIGYDLPLPSFSRVAVREINRILDKTGAKIVLSTSWRFDEGCISDLLRRGVRLDGNLIGTTGVCRNTRGEEIFQWLEEHGWPLRFVALDDNASGMELIGGAFIQTDPAVGLTRAVADKAIARLRSRSVART
jgi:hypothetical protein